MNRTNTKIKAIGTSLKAWKELSNRSSALKVPKVTCVQSYFTTYIYNFSSPSLMSDKEATFPFERISPHGFLPSTPEAELPKVRERRRI